MALGRSLVSALMLGAVVAAAPGRAQVVVEPDRRVPTGFSIQDYPNGKNPVVATSAGTSVHFRVFAGGPIAGSTFMLSRSTDGGATWPPFQTVGSPPIRAGQVALTADTSGTFYVLWREAVTSTDLTLLFQTLSFSGDTPVWGPSRRIVPVEAEPFQPEMVCDARHRSLYVAYTWRRGTESNVYYLRSGDLGETWSEPLDLSGPGCDRPQVVLGPDGELYILWVDELAGLVRGCQSEDHGLSFGLPFTVGTYFDNHNTSPYEYVTDSYDFNVRTDRRFSTLYPNLLRATVDRSNGPHRGRLYASWVDFAQGAPGPFRSYRVDIEPNNTVATAQPCAIGDDLSGFIASADCIGCDGVDVWRFDGTAGQTLRINATVQFDPPYEFPDWSTLRVFYALPSGRLAPLASSQYSIVGQSVEPMVVTLPRTGSYYFAIGNGGPSSKSYSISIRELQVSPGSVARDQRDVVLASSGDGGTTWEKVRMGDVPPQYDESLPEIVVDDQGLLHANWLDRRDAPLGYGEQTDAYWSYSFDGGRKFAPGTRLSSTSTSWQTFGGYQQYAGEHNALAAIGPWVVAFWVDNRRPPVLNDDYPDLWFTRARVDAVVSIAVPRFVAMPDPAGVRLAWTVQDGRGIRGFRVHRAAGGSEVFAPLGNEELPLVGNVEHERVDDTAEPGATYRYRLEVLRTTGPSTWEGPVELSLPASARALAWSRPWPNPTESATRLTLRVLREGVANVGVYDVAGQRVAQLHAGALAAGTHEWRWPAAIGSRPAPGVYLVRAECAGEASSARVVVVR